jgi:protein O-mannosyl-transferase
MGDESRDSLKMPASGPSTPVALGLIALLVLGCYAATLSSGFVWDDVNQVENNFYIRDANQIPRILTSDLWMTSGAHRQSGFYRPMQNLSYMLDYKLLGPNAWGFHLTNLALHLACCFLVFGISRQTGLSIIAALIAGAVFAVHPLHVEEVAFIGGRGGLLSAMFHLAALYLVLHAFENDPPCPYCLVLAIPAFFLGLMSKPLPILFPLILAMVPWLTAKGTSFKEKARWSVGIAAFAGLFTGIYLILRHTFAQTHSAVQDLSPLSAIAAVPSITWFYLGKILAPFGLSTDYGFQPGDVPAVVAVVVGGLMVLAGIASVIGLVRGSRAGFWTLFFLLLVIPLGGLRDMYAVVADRYMYLPIAAFGVALGAGYERAGSKKKAIGFAAGLVIVALAILSFSRTGIYRDQESFLADLRKTAADRPRGILAQAFHHAKNGEIEGAIASVEKGLSTHPENRSLRLQLARYLYEAGREDEAAGLLSQVLRAKPDDADTLEFLAKIVMDKGDYAKSLQLTEQILSAEPGKLSAKLRKAVLLEAAGKKEQALALVVEILEKAPLHERANAFAGLLLVRQGKKEEAVSYLRTSLMINPDDPTVAEALEEALSPPSP